MSLGWVPQEWGHSILKRQVQIWQIYELSLPLNILVRCNSKPVYSVLIAGCSCWKVSFKWLPLGTVVAPICLFLAEDSPEINTHGGELWFRLVENYSASLEYWIMYCTKLALWKMAYILVYDKTRLWDTEVSADVKLLCVFCKVDNVQLIEC